MGDKVRERERENQKDMNRKRLFKRNLILPQNRIQLICNQGSV